MEYDGEDLVAAQVLEAQMALEVVSGFLSIPVKDLISGERTQAEAFVANAPKLFQKDRDTENLFMALDIGISAIQTDPTYGGGYTLVAECVYRLGVIDTDNYDSRALKEAGPWAKRAVVVDPDYDLGWESLLTVLCYLKDFKPAEAMLGKVYKLFGDNDLYARTAFNFFRLKGDTRQALEWGALAWQTEWDTERLVSTLFSLGRLYLQQQEYVRALDAYRVITEKAHDNSWAYHYMAICLNHLDQKAEAIECNLQALAQGDVLEFRHFQDQLQPPRGNSRRFNKPGATVKVPPSMTTPPPAATSSQIVQAPEPAASPAGPRLPNKRKRRPRR
ncbi:MAG: tetratricopeptide repeat protein [Planctomycetes bacterium]|nr:tetratricopeptide repeat protein [Planctomycetota bacterium]